MGNSKYYAKKREERIKYQKEYYREHREEILKKQSEYWKKKYQQDPVFRQKRMLRDKSRWDESENRKIDTPCVKCGSTKDLQRHHPDYHKKEYIILCRACHTAEHRKINEARIKELT